MISSAQKLAILLCGLVGLAVPPLAAGQAAECTKCHGNLTQEKVVHAPLQTGCTACHDGVDASSVPHKFTDPASKGLAAPQRQLCLTCHEKASFANKVVHAPVSTGCTMCHDPHSSKYEKLLTAAVPALCHDCHEAKDFKGKVTHAPVAAGGCTGCHAVHASEHAGLTLLPTVELCLACHGAIAKKPHVVAGLTQSGHPLGHEKRATPAKDPLRAGKPFNCVSCHDPHKSDSRKLSRFEAKTAMATCRKCHRL